MNQLLFRMADFLSRPPGFYFVILAMAGSTAFIPFGFTNVITYALSVAAIVVTSIVLIQGYRDTAAIHAKLDEIIVSMRETRTRWSALSTNSRSRFRRQSSGSKRKLTDKTKPGPLSSGLHICS